ncbi:MAG TPA: hypothetical protein VFG54_12410 [Prolixibacteraceae bacterium]|nr:hypothetical protein [Prolixibacteraceae bacterium]
MKKIILHFSVLAVFVFAASFVYAADPATEETNEVEITAVDDLHLGNSIEKLWKLSFSKQETPVTVALRPVANGTEYVVRSEFFEVIYAYDKNGFGVRKIHSSLKGVPDPINYSVLNKQQLQQQRILTPNKVSDEVALGLITSYLPDLLNEDYRHLIY